MIGLPYEWWTHINCEADAVKGGYKLSRRDNFIESIAAAAMATAAKRSRSAQIDLHRVREMLGS
jgi:hypothetical protein